MGVPRLGQPLPHHITSVTVVSSVSHGEPHGLSEGWAPSFWCGMSGVGPENPHVAK